MQSDSQKELPLFIAAIAFFLLWGLLGLTMLMAWLFQSMEDTLYGVLILGVLLYGLVTLVYSVMTLRNPGQNRQRILWLLYIPVPLAIFAVLEWLY